MAKIDCKTLLAEPIFWVLGGVIAHPNSDAESLKEVLELWGIKISLPKIKKTLKDLEGMGAIAKVNNLYVENSDFIEKVYKECKTEESKYWFERFLEREFKD